MAGEGLSVTFAGVSTLLVSDGESAVLTDGFFTRPSLARVLTRRLAGGFTKSVTQDVQTGVTGAVGHDRSAMMKSTWEYNKQRAYCTHQAGEQPVATDEYRWIPNKFTGTFADYDAVMTWDCPTDHDTTARIQPGNTLWFAKESSVIYSGFFKIANVSLGARQLNSSSTKLTWTANTSAVAKVCGRDDYPPYATQVREYP